MSRSKDKLAPWIPSTKEVILEALRIANVNVNDVLYDLGAGDGRVTIIAAKDFGARCVAVEIDDKLCGIIHSMAKYYGLLGRIRVLCNDFLSVDISNATIVYMYLYRSINEVLAKKLEKELSIGTRILTIDFPIPGWQPIRIKRLVDRTGLARTIFFYIIGASNPKALIKRINPVTKEVLMRMGLLKDKGDIGIEDTSKKAKETSMD